MKRIIFIIVLGILVSGCQATSLVNLNSSKLTPEYACILKETYSENNEEIPTDIAAFLADKKIECDGSSVKEADEPEFEVVKIIKSEEKKEKEAEKKEKEDDDFFIVKRPRIR
tara:strand:+ start:614 stop:952 length:339 start_codon:yes stop_codon:yes gene_type:complete